MMHDFLQAVGWGAGCGVVIVAAIAGIAWATCDPTPPTQPVSFSTLHPDAQDEMREIEQQHTEYKK